MRRAALLLLLAAAGLVQAQTLTLTQATTVTANPAPFTLDLLAPTAAGTPASPPNTTRDFVNVLGRTAPGSVVRVGGESVTVFATGVFARDRIPLQMGANRIRIEATSSTGQTQERTLDIERLPPPAGVVWPADRLFIDGGSLRPAEPLRVAPGEAVEVAVRATPAQRVEARLPGQRWQPLAESRHNAGRYRALLLFEGVADVDAAPVQVRITPLILPRLSGVNVPKSITVLTPGDAGQWREDLERLYSVGPKVPNCCMACTRCAWAAPSWPTCRQAPCCAPRARWASTCVCNCRPTSRPGCPLRPCRPPSPAHAHRMRPSPACRWPATPKAM